MEIAEIDLIDRRGSQGPTPDYIHEHAFAYVEALVKRGLLLREARRIKANSVLIVQFLPIRAKMPSRKI